MKSTFYTNGYLTRRTSIQVNMKAKPTFYRGIEFVKLSDLSNDQLEAVKHENGPEQIKIMTNKGIIEPCILFTSYSKWYATIFKNAHIESPKSTPVNTADPVNVSVKKF